MIRLVVGLDVSFLLKLIDIDKICVFLVKVELVEFNKDVLVLCYFGVLIGELVLM